MVTEMIDEESLPLMFMADTVFLSCNTYPLPTCNLRPDLGGGGGGNTAVTLGLKAHFPSIQRCAVLGTRGRSLLFLEAIS